MDLVDKLRQIADRVPDQLPHLQTEESTKNALVMPFLAALGYDVFNPTEVVPEFTADVGSKKGEKVDYAIMRDGKPVILVECKWSRADLDSVHASQLRRYFHVTEARFSILTNGLEYRIYTDLDAANKMDEKPFLDFDIRSLDARVVDEIKKFSRSTFDLANILDTASTLKYTKGLKRALAAELANPTEDFVSHLTRSVYSGRLTQQVKDEFTGIVKKAFQEFISDRVNERLQSALERDTGNTPPEQEEQEIPAEDDDGIVTTQEEIEGFHIVKGIVRAVVDGERIVMRDTKSYCGILLDDNNRKPICRLRFNSSQKYLGTFDAEKNETKHPLARLEDIYEHADALRAAAEQHK